MHVALDSAKEERKRWNETIVKKQLQERDQMQDVKRFMKQALIVKQRHAVKEGAAGDKGHKTFL